MEKLIIISVDVRGINDHIRFYSQNACMTVSSINDRIRFRDWLLDLHNSTQRACTEVLTPQCPHTRCYFNVRSKADISQLNLPHLFTTTYETTNCRQHLNRN